MIDGDFISFKKVTGISVGYASVTQDGYFCKNCTFVYEIIFKNGIFKDAYHFYDYDFMMDYVKNNCKREVYESIFIHKNS